MKQLIHLNQKRRINPATPGAGLAQLSGLQAIDALPNEVGYDESITIDWNFSVVNNEFYSANSSQHKIYRTLDTPSAHYHTSVDVACNNVSGTNETTVVNSIWGKFEGLNITSADGYPMTYWGNGANTPNSLAELVSLHNGRWRAWAFFFKDVLDVHSITATARGIKPMISFGYDRYLVMPYALCVNETFPDQNNAHPPCQFSDHRIVLYNNKIYDPSYGKTFNSIDEWESTCIDIFWVYRIEDPNYRDIVPNPPFTQCGFINE